MENENKVQNVKVIRENCCQNHYKTNWQQQIQVSNTLYGMGFLGALICFVVNSRGLVSILIGIFKAIFWPALVVFNLLKFFKL